MFVGIGIKNAKNYSIDKFNLLRKRVYTVRIGPVYTKMKLKELAGNNRLLDDFVISELGKVVPPVYNRLKPTA